MNFFLYINRRLIFFLGILTLFFFLLSVLSKQINIRNNEINVTNRNYSNVDISEPKFSMNNASKKIFITAEEGNFLNQNEVLLKKNVKFKSNDFSIETENVIFDRNKQTAHSNTKSLFKSKNTTISSDGFNIFDNGNKIIFHGNSFIVLK